MRAETCPWCHDRAMMLSAESGGFAMTADVVGGTLCISGCQRGVPHRGGAGIVVEYVPIRYCPMCGRYIGDEESGR